jgi:hypothetical protein
MNWPDQIKIRNKILRGEEAAAARVSPSPRPVVDWFALAEQQARQAETERLDREKRLSDEHVARLQQQAAGRQLAQDLWAQARGELRNKVIEAQRQVATATNLANSADDDEAGRGVLALAVAERRLAQAERDFAFHMQRMP